jgi:hypothetical protein
VCPVDDAEESFWMVIVYEEAGMITVAIAEGLA